MTARAARGIAGAAGLVAVLTLVARLAGFGRTLVFADSVRTAGIGEIYNAVNAVPNVLYEVAAGGALAAVAVPLVAGHLGRGERAGADQVASALLTWALTLLVPLALVIWIAAAPIAARLAPAGAAEGALMLRIFAVQVPLYGVGVVLGGLLQSHRRFGAVAVAPLLSSLVVIATYAAYGSLAQGRIAGVGDGALRLLAWGTTAGVAALSLPLLVPAWRTGWRWTPTWRFPPGDAARVRHLAGAGLVALATQQAAVLTTIWVAGNWGGQGTLSVYGYVQAVYLLPYAVLAVPLATAAFPNLSAEVGAGSSAAPDLLARTCRRVVVLAGTGVVGLVAAAPAVERFFVALDGRRAAGEVSGEALLGLGAALRSFAPGLLGLAVAALLVRALYARGRAGAAGLAVALGWAVAAIVPLLVLGESSSPTRVLVVLGAASSVGLTLAGLALVRLVRQAWGAAAVASLRSTTLAVVIALAASCLAVAWIGRMPVFSGAGLASSVATGAALAVLGIGVFVAVLAVAHRPTLDLVLPRRAAKEPA